MQSNVDKTNDLQLLVVISDAGGDGEHQRNGIQVSVNRMPISLSALHTQDAIQGQQAFDS